MSDDLFDLPESLSPKLAFLRDHSLVIMPFGRNGFRCYLDDETFGAGATEEEAIIDFCVQTKLPHFSQNP